MFKSMMTKHLDFKVVLAATQQALVKTFTAEELQAMSDFYSTSVGKSISQKLGYYMSNMMPALQLEMTRAAQAAASEMKQDLDQ
jgi:hypothetical protein